MKLDDIVLIKYIMKAGTRSNITGNKTSKDSVTYIQGILTDIATSAKYGDTYEVNGISINIKDILAKKVLL